MAETWAMRRPTAQAADKGHHQHVNHEEKKADITRNYGKAARVDTLRDENFRSEKLRHKQVFDYNETYLADKQSGVRRKLKEKDANGEPKKVKISP